MVNASPHKYVVCTVVNCSLVAAIPTCNIGSLAICKYGGGRAWEIGHIWVMSGRQRVDTWGAVPDEES